MPSFSNGPVGRKSVRLAALVLLGLPCTTLADSRNAFAMIDIEAPAQRVWDFVDDFEEFHTWNPSVAATRVLRGSGRDVGSIRQLEFRNGARMSQELTRLDPGLMRKEWQLIGWSVFPMEEYRASLSVIEVAPTRSMVVWQSRFTTKSVLTEADEALVENGISSLYRLRLTRLKFLSESR